MQTVCLVQFAPRYFCSPWLALPLHGLCGPRWELQDPSSLLAGGFLLPPPRPGTQPAASDQGPSRESAQIEGDAGWPKVIVLHPAPGSAIAVCGRARGKGRLWAAFVLRSTLLPGSLPAAGCRASRLPEDTWQPWLGATSIRCLQQPWLNKEYRVLHFLL